MPHKRAKHSARMADRQAKGRDLPPRTFKDGLEDMPKGAMRILNAAKIQAEYNHRRREAQRSKEGGKVITASSTAAKGKGKAKAGGAEAEEAASNLHIRPGEKLSDFARRVDNAMASDVHAVIKASQGTKKKRKADTDDGLANANAQINGKARNLESTKGNDQQNGSSNKAQPVEEERDWQKASQRRRINDVVDAPPTLTKAPRGHSVDGLRRKAELERERERAIKAYRDAKQQKIDGSTR